MVLAGVRFPGARLSDAVGCWGGISLTLGEEMTMRMRMSRKEMTQAIAREQYAWPGGYMLLGVTDDGELLCSRCIRENYREIRWSQRHKASDGWNVLGWTHTGQEDGPIVCAHCCEIVLD